MGEYQHQLLASLDEQNSPDRLKTELTEEDFLEDSVENYFLTSFSSD
jgi:hypothetical protein